MHERRHSPPGARRRRAPNANKKRTAARAKVGADTGGASLFTEVMESLRKRDRAADAAAGRNRLARPAY